MNPQNLYDLTPLARLLLGGAALTSLALLFWWLRHGATDAGQRKRSLLLLTLFLTFDLVLVGSFTRLTDSGLGCPDWPGCYGNASPLGAHGQIAQAQADMPSGPVTHQKAWIEMLHRYLAMGVSGLIAVQAAWAWWDRRRVRGVVSPSPWWPTATLGWIALQGAFGALTVTMKLFPAIVALHLLGAYVLLVLLVLQLSAQVVPAKGALLPAGLRAGVAAGLAVVVVQAMLGAWVSTNYAVLACNEFPLCQGQWWPLMDFGSGFTLWRPLGLTAQGDPLSFQALTAIHIVHRVFAGLTTVVMLYLLRGLWRLLGVRTAVRWLAALLGLQLITGLSNVVLDWPLVAALLHTAGAGALIAVLAWLMAWRAPMAAEARTAGDAA